MVDCEIALCGILNRISRPLISRLGDGTAWYALILVLPLAYGEPGLMTSLSMVQVGVVNLALYKIIKSFTGRARPCTASAEITLGTAPLDQYSFPSGHTMHAVAFSLIATAQHPELAWILVPLSGLIALSRVILGLHYPTDVLAGGVIGAYLASRARLFPKKERRIFHASESRVTHYRSDEIIGPRTDLDVLSVNKKLSSCELDRYGQVRLLGPDAYNQLRLNNIIDSHERPWLAESR